MKQPATLSVEQQLDMLPGDPFAFLVIEQIVKAKALSRVKPLTPLQYVLGSQKAQHDQDMQAYRQICWICDQKFAELVQRILTIQVDDSLLDYELKLKRRRRAEKVKDKIQELRDQHEIETERLRLQGLGHSDRLDDLKRQQEHFDLEASKSLSREIDRLRATNLATLEYQRGVYDQVTSRQLKLTQAHERRLRELETAFALELAQVMPDTSDPEYQATRRRKAFDIYVEKQRQIWNDPDIDDDQRHQELKLLLELGKKI